MTAGSLFSGYGGLDLAVEAVFDATTAWHAEVEDAPSAILAARWPGVPNLGDVTTIDWSTVEPVDVIAGGSPCQDVSPAGKRAGMRPGTRSGLWASMVDAIDIIRPRFVVWENVRGVLSAEADSALEPCPGCMGDGDDGPVLRALGRVLGDLADLGYDARWYGLRAADVGAPHGRFRIFVLAALADRGGRERRPETDRSGWSDGSGSRPATSGPRRDTATDAAHHDSDRGAGARAAGRRAGRATPDAAHVGHERGRPSRRWGNGPADRCLAAADADDSGSQGREPTAGRHMPTRGATPDATRDTGRISDRDGAIASDTDRDGREGVGRVDTGRRDANRRDRQDGSRAQVEREASVDGDDTQGRSGEVLRDVRGSDGAEAVRAAARGPRGVPGAAQLLSGMREQQDGRADELLPLAGTQGSYAHNLRDMRSEDGPARAPRRPEPSEQRAGQPDDTLFVVSSPAALAGGPRGEAGSCETSEGYGCSAWGKYAPAVHRWEMVLGRLAPPPTELAPRGGQRLSARAVEWMMGLPAGWVTDVPGITRNEQLKALGNGVVPQQAEAALRAMLTACEVAA